MKKQFRRRCLLVGTCLSAIIVVLNVTTKDEPQKTVSVEPQLLQANMIYTVEPPHYNTFRVKGIH